MDDIGLYYSRRRICMSGIYMGIEKGREERGEKKSSAMRGMVYGSCTHCSDGVSKENGERTFAGKYLMNTCTL